MKAKLMIGTAGLILAGGMVMSLFSSTAPNPRHAEIQVFMRQKMAWSQAALEGLTLEKFDAVSSSALRMRNMTQSNYWYAFRYPDYLTLTTNFQKSANALYLAATEKNLNAATEAYTRLTRDCVECHRHFRLEQLKQSGGAPVTPKR